MNTEKSINEEKGNAVLPLVINWVAIKDQLPPENKWIIQLDHIGNPKLQKFDKVTKDNMMPKIFPYWIEVPEPPCL